MMLTQIVSFNITKLDTVIHFSVGIVLAGILIKVLLPRQSFNMSNLSELYIVSAKMVGYILLATYIYTYLHANEIKKVDVLTFFTFTLAVLEAAHCLFIISSNSFADFFRKFFYINNE